ncbi:MULTISPECIES: flagellar motor protein [Carboxydocella]|uniref:Chemotaxis protein MotA n=2 Tax=Carboxydocella TaxID=178898 RepID=A0A1T4PAE8_9FIRM|nr:MULTISPECIES: flagellar motor protein [Carboxydocella]AVX20764.1 chemotaxis protein MotA [Carboxydocella thermautotrophica]AVX31183.1 chemotaxis protein MotA [Carboxydocella thermautotrophica]SJZ88439.1 chemotaxis protein MotA [Carboxydocella sporoproducens DSM 16521]GAW28293.1 motility protein A [Carboxydocella sp. ULO1]GAW32136.1 motility protein A [Carboxydocella sp. JDF658]
MDLATIIGLVLAIASLLISVILEGGELHSLINESAALLVFGGTIGATLICYSLEDIKEIGKVLKIAFTTQKTDPISVIENLVSFAERARREGLLALENETSSMDDDFLRKGIQLIVDGTDPELVRNILETELAFLEQRHHRSASIFETAGGFAPTMGIIGTVMGLVHVLGNLSDVAGLGPAIATAFIATFYGVSSANVIFLPLANKLKGKSSTEQLIREIMIEGILSIQAGENPRIVKEKLMAFLSPKIRSQLPVEGGEK